MWTEREENLTLNNNLKMNAWNSGYRDWHPAIFNLFYCAYDVLETLWEQIRSFYLSYFYLPFIDMKEHWLRTVSIMSALAITKKVYSNKFSISFIRSESDSYSMPTTFSPRKISPVICKNDLAKLTSAPRLYMNRIECRSYFTYALWCIPVS